MRWDIHGDAETEVEDLYKTDWVAWALLLADLDLLTENDGWVDPWCQIAAGRVWMMSPPMRDSQDRQRPEMSVFYVIRRDGGGVGVLHLCEAGLVDMSGPCALARFRLKGEPEW